MSAIRPDLPASIAPPAAPVTAAARAAQAAFFRAAVDQAAAAPTTPRTSAGQADADTAPRLPRPGALLDIRV